MDAWKNAPGRPATSAGRPARCEAVSSDFNDKMKELLGVLAQLGFKNARDARSLVYHCYHLPPGQATKEKPAYQYGAKYATVVFMMLDASLPRMNMEPV